MSISIDTNAVAYGYPGVSHRVPDKISSSVLNEKISSLETKHSGLRLPAHQNSKLTEFYTGNDKIPDVSGLNLGEARHLLNDEKVFPLIS